MKLSELVRSEAAYAGATEIYLPSGKRTHLNQLPTIKAKKVSKKEIKDIIGKEEKKKKKPKKGDSSFFKF